MAILDTSGYTFTPKQVQEMNEAIKETVFEHPAIAEFLSVVEDIHTDDQIVILGQFTGLSGKGTGGCNQAADAKSIPLTELTWNPKIFANNIKVCHDELDGSFWVWAKNNGLKRSELTNTEFWDFMVDRFADLLKKEVLNVSWFNDSAADVTPGGVITIGTDLAFVNKNDGFWKQIFTYVTADAKRRTSILSPRNAQATFADQEFTEADTTARVVTKALQKTKFKADLRLREDEGKMFMVTQSVADQYEQELIADAAAYTWERTEDGVDVLKSGSISVFPQPYWDRFITAFESDGTRYNLPHRILLMTKNAFQIGTESEGTLGESKTIYDEVNEDMYLRSNYKLDAKIPEAYFMQVDY